MTAALHQRWFNHQDLVRAGTVTNHTIDATNDAVGYVFQAESTDPITHIGTRYGARTGTPPVQVATLEGLDGSGLPDGTDVGGGSPTAKTFTPPADATWDATWQWLQLTNAYTPTIGQILCGTIRYSSGTVDASNNSTWQRNTAGLAGDVRGFPYVVVLTAGTWSKPTSTAPAFAYRTASNRFGLYFQSNYTTATANTAGHMSGMYFTVPSGLGTSYQIAGVNIVGKLGAAGGSYKIGIWSTDGTERAITPTIDADFNATTPGANISHNPILFSTNPRYDLQYGTKYYCGVQVVSGTVLTHGYVLASADDRSIFPNGMNRGLVTYNGTTYTETDTVMPQIDLIIEDITVPAGGGGAFIIGG